MKKITFLIILLGLFAIANSQAQFPGSSIQVVVKGIVKDEFTNKPLGVLIQFKTANGKKIKINSNSIDGQFEQVFPAGEKVQVTLSGDNIFRTEFDFQVMNTEKYMEQKVEWTAKSIRVGAKVMSTNLFENGSTDLNQEAKQKLEELKEILRFNRNVNVDLSINASDVKPANVEEPAKSKNKRRGKNSTKPVSSTPAVDLNQIVDARLNSLESYFKSWGTDAKRVTLKPDYDMEQGKNMNNANIAVTEVRNLFGK